MDWYRHVPAASGPPCPEYTVEQSPVQRKIFWVSYLPDRDRRTAYFVYVRPRVQQCRVVAACVFVPVHRRRPLPCANSAHALRLLELCAPGSSPGPALEYGHGHPGQRKEKIPPPEDSSAYLGGGGGSLWPLRLPYTPDRDVHALAVTLRIFRL